MEKINKIRKRDRDKIDIKKGKTGLQIMCKGVFSRKFSRRGVWHAQSGAGTGGGVNIHHKSGGKKTPSIRIITRDEKQKGG